MVIFHCGPSPLWPVRAGPGQNAEMVNTYAARSRKTLTKLFSPGCFRVILSRRVRERFVSRNPLIDLAARRAN